MATFIKLTAEEDGLPVLVRTKWIRTVTEGPLHTYITLKGQSYATRVKESVSAIEEKLEDAS